MRRIALKPSSGFRPPARLRARVLVDAGLVRPSLLERSAWKIRCAAFGVGLSLFGLWFVRGATAGDGGAIHDPWIAFLVPAALAAMMTWGALRHGKGNFGPAVVQLAGACFLGPIALALVALASHLDPMSKAGMVAAASMVSEPHATIGGALGLLLVLLALAPPADPTRAMWKGAALGAAAGAWVSVSCGFTCPILESSHVIALHVVYVPLLAAAGAALAYGYDRLLFGAPQKTQ